MLTQEEKLAIINAPDMMINYYTNIGPGGVSVEYTAQGKR